MKNNNPPNGHSHINDRMAQAIRQREGQLRDALKQIQTLNLGIQSISTLAAMYKVQLQEVFNHLGEQSYCFIENIPKHNALLEKTKKLLAAGHMEPVNEILRLQANLAEHERLHGEINKILHPKGDGPAKPSLCDLVSYIRSDRAKDKELIDSQRNMIEQMEKEVRDLEAQIKTKNAKIEELGGYVGDI